MKRYSKHILFGAGIVLAIFSIPALPTYYDNRLVLPLNGSVAMIAGPTNLVTSEKAIFRGTAGTKEAMLAGDPAILWVLAPSNSIARIDGTLIPMGGGWGILTPNGLILVKPATPWLCTFLSLYITHLQELSPLLASLFAALVTLFIGFLSAQSTWAKIKLDTRAQRRATQLAALTTKLQLYERRLAAFQDVYTFITSSNGDTSVDTLTAFLKKAHETRFLFGKDVASFTWLLYRKAIQRRRHRQQSCGVNALPPGDERNKATEKEVELDLWLHQQLETAEEIFGRYIRLDEGTQRGVSPLMK